MVRRGAAPSLLFGWTAAYCGVTWVETLLEHIMRICIILFLLCGLPPGEPVVLLVDKQGRERTLKP
jgi:hypothetical protein